MKLRSGETLHGRRYEIKELLRSAPNKDVYRAYYRDLAFEVCIDAFSNNYLMPSGLTVSAWEARVLGRLGGHPNIAQVVEHWEDGHGAFMVTRYLSGGRVEDLVTNAKGIGRRLTLRRILRLSSEISNGLAYIHQRGILYRDMQPHNVLLDEGGTAHLVDFDTAVLLDDNDMGNLAHRSVIDYMAPELIEGSSADERADLYSLGATIYAMCEGDPPFKGTREQILAARRASRPPLKRDDLPAELRDLIFGLLNPDCGQRPASAAEVVSRLDSLRTAFINLDRVLDSKLGTILKATLKVYLKEDSSAFMRSPSSASLPDDHRCLMQAIIELSETDYRRAVIDACTAAEVALSCAIADGMSKKNWTGGAIDETIRKANGLVGLFTLYSRLHIGASLPISQSDMWNNLVQVRNEAAHKGWIPSASKATQAVELAHALVETAHPFVKKA